MISSSSSASIAFWEGIVCGVAFLEATRFRCLTECLYLIHIPHCHSNFAAVLCFSALKALMIVMSSLSETGGEWHPINVVSEP